MTERLKFSYLYPIVAAMEGFSRINRSGIVFSKVDREDVRGPVRLSEHTLLYVHSGRVEVTYEGRKIPLCAGDCVFLRKDYRVVLDAWAPENGEPFRSVALFFCHKFLLSYYRGVSRDELPLDARASEEAVLKIPAGPRLESLFLSLTPYLDRTEDMSPDVAWEKRLEGLRCVLSTDRSFYASLFTFAQPWKIDLLSFMEDNYLYDLSLSELAGYTGRSLSSFKRDFKKVSSITPERWVQRRRLQDAHRLLSSGKYKVGEAMAEAAFKDPAVFSRAYRRQYGYPPRETPISSD